VGIQGLGEGGEADEIREHHGRFLVRLRHLLLAPLEAFGVPAAELDSPIADLLDRSPLGRSPYA
jgi:hypothetical protein